MEMDPTQFDLYTTNYPTARSTWFYWVELSCFRRCQSQTVRVSFCCDCEGDCCVIHVDVPSVPDKIISNIMGELAQMEHDMGEEAPI